MLREAGYATTMLPAPVDRSTAMSLNSKDYADWLGVEQSEDAAQTLEALGDFRPDWLVVDHYGLDATWERPFQSRVGHIFVIDDLANRPHECDLLLDQSLQEPGRYTGLIRNTCVPLIGPKYALLRPEFVTARQNIRTWKDDRASRLLVFFGGIDAGGETFKALSAIKMLDRADVTADVVIGQANPHRALIKAACSKLPNVTLRSQIENMAALMTACDLFVGAGGTSSWERCCLGLPALVLATADNQIIQSIALARAGAHLYLGQAHSVSAERLARLIDEMLGFPEMLMHMTEQGQDIVDGRGTIRVANCMMSSMSIDLRRAEPTDSRSIFTWRNHPNTRHHSLNPAEIAWDTHERWFAAVQADPNRELLIAEQEHQPVGVLRYDIEGSCARVSIYLVPGLAGRGLGAHLLLAGEDWLRGHHQEVSTLEARIRPGNAASHSVFQSAGFTYEYSILKKSIHGRH